MLRVKAESHVSFSATQQQILALISSGATVAASARQAGIHRNTIYNWLRSSGFRNAVDKARYDAAIHWHEQATTLAEAALNTLAEILDNPDAPASVRARIALAIVARAATPPPPSPFAGPPDDTQDPDVQDPEIVPKSAQSPVVSTAKTGRNDPCPCGSGLKFKRRVKPLLRPSIEVRHTTGRAGGFACQTHPT